MISYAQTLEQIHDQLVGENVPEDIIYFAYRSAEIMLGTEETFD